MTETEIIVEQQPPQGFYILDHAGRVINRFTLASRESQNLLCVCRCPQQVTRCGRLVVRLGSELPLTQNNPRNHPARQERYTEGCGLTSRAPPGGTGSFERTRRKEHLHPEEQLLLPDRALRRDRCRGLPFALQAAHSPVGPPRRMKRVQRYSPPRRVRIQICSNLKFCKATSCDPSCSWTGYLAGSSARGIQGAG